MSRGSGDHASTSSIGLVVASVFFAAAFLVAQTMVGAPQGKDPRTAMLTAEAQAALDVLVREAGRTAASAAWATDPDNMTRFGLAEDGRPQFLDYEKVKALRNGSTTQQSLNKAPDYPEVRAALGVTQGDFHLRSYPVLISVDDARWVKDTSLRVAYFAHYDSPTAPAEISAASTLQSASLNVTVTVTNRHTSPAIYTALVSLGDRDSGEKVVTEERRTVLLPPGQAQTLFVNFWSLASWDSDIDGVHVLVTDSYGNVAVDTSGDEIGDFWLASPQPPTSSPNAYNHLVSAGSVYYESGATVRFYVDHYDKDMSHVNNAKARLVLVGPNGREWSNATVDLPRQPNKVYEHECSNCTTVGNYTLVVWDTPLTRFHADVVHVSAARMFTESLGLDPAAQKEIDILQELTTGFNPTRYDADTNPGGDIFGDDSNGPSAVVDVLSRYTTLIIGSEVKQTALTPSETKYGIANWVKNEGGNLVVLGTYKQQSRWLEPVYDAAQQTANGGISAPDPTHAVLSTPEKLDYRRYLDRGRAWSIGKDQPFTHVLTRGESGSDVLDTLAVSEPGAYNDGTVVLTSYMPGSLTSPQDDREAKRLLHNLMSQGHSMLFLDYGPAIPSGTPVGSATRLVVVPHPNLADVEVEVRLVLYMW